MATCDCIQRGAKEVFGFPVGEDAGSIWLCQQCYDRLKGAVLQDVLNEALSQGIKTLSFSKKYGG